VNFYRISTILARGRAEFEFGAAIGAPLKQTNEKRFTVPAGIDPAVLTTLKMIGAMCCKWNADNVPPLIAVVTRRWV
jgi:hypothetical protein